MVELKDFFRIKPCMVVELKAVDTEPFGLVHEILLYLATIIFSRI